ncbi:MAG: cisplatin damage response ATP-dependent DNA ligase [Rubrivivax sp.]|nr:cisplatin damage response ATP-dependent DNA ligase [Rubrivivax sp.]
MRRFAALYQQLDAGTATSGKLAALREYFAAAPAADAAWAVYFLAGGKPRQVVPTAVLRSTAMRLAGIDAWLFEECYQAVGDLAETIALVLPAPQAEGGDAGAREPAAAPGAPGAPGAADPPETPGAGGTPGRAEREQTPTSPTAQGGLGHWVEERLLPLRGLAPEEQAQRLAQAFAVLDTPGRFLLVKLIGGGFRVGVSKLLVQRALAEVAGLDAKLVAQRMMGYAEARATPSAARYAALLAPVQAAADEGGGAPGLAGTAGPAPAESGQPYPFFLAHALQADVAALDETIGPVADWLLEWKFDGIRAQLVRRAGGTWIWSRGEELVTDRFPEVVQAARALPDGTVLDGELLVWPEGAPVPRPFQLLQQRIGRKTLTRKVLAEAPVAFVAYDLLESDGVDRRGEPQHARRARLQALAGVRPDTGGQGVAGAAAVSISPRLAAASWAEAAAQRTTARERGVEGLMLKHLQSRYGSGRTKSEGTWWKWKVEPLAVDAVLVYAQAGHGRRASVYTDYTFAVWNRPPRDAAEAQAVLEAIARREPAPREADAADSALQLLPFAKAYSGLTDEEFQAVDREIRRHTLDRFGPVRSVRPTLVFEIGFEGIQASPRHKSGIAVRFPRMLRIRRDKPLHEADSLQTLRALLPG